MFEKVKTISDFEREKLAELSDALILLNGNEIDLIELALALEPKAVGFGRFCEIVIDTLKTNARKQIGKYKITDKRLSEYEKEHILTKYVFALKYGSMPQWLKDLY